MNWYKLFYWISVADGVKSVLLILAIIGGVLSGFAILTYIFCGPFTDYEKPFTENTKKITSKTMKWLIPLTIFCALLTVFIPSKRDSLIIVAGGAVGNFLTRDTSAKQVPSEVFQLLREKIKSEIDELHLSDNTDTLKEKTKEELINIIKDKAK